MSFDADEQLEMLTYLLNDGQFGQENGHGQQRSEPAHIVAAQQPTESTILTRGVSVVETRADPGREQRKGVPEIVFGESKDVAQIIAMAQGLLAGSGRAIISRVRPEMIASLQAAFQGYPLRVAELARSLVIYCPGYVRPSTGGHVGVISAGTSDIPVAEEATLIAEEMGCQVTRIYDVGVAGLHRLMEPLRELLSADADVVIVAAGMDGALPSVVAGLVPVPVIGLPTSIGYGMGGKGLAALLSMLQTCAPGLSVVNIDNGVGAGSTAALIANRVAHARRQREHQVQ
jgi:pyridinium-3,5-biscarboxylic acid mononucleotide synthase